MNYIDIIESRCRYKDLLEELCEEVYIDLKIKGMVEVSCNDSIVIRTDDKLSDEQLKELKNKGFLGYEFCHAREDYVYHYILHGKWEA